MGQNKLDETCRATPPLAAKAATVADEHEAAEAAYDEEHAAEAALLDRILANVLEAAGQMQNKGLSDMSLEELEEAESAFHEAKQLLSGAVQKRSRLIEEVLVVL